MRTSRQERKQRGTIIIGNPVRRAFETMATSTESNTSGYLPTGIMVTFAVYPRLFSHYFDIQSTTRKSHCHGYSRRLPALAVNHFDNQCSICLSPPKTKINERFARPSTMVSLKCIYVIINRQGSRNIRHGIAWAQTGHSTCTSTATLCVFEL